MLNLISWNVKGLNRPIKRSRVHLSQLHVGKAQETHFRNTDVNRICRSWVGEVYHSGFNSKARGTTIYTIYTIYYLFTKIFPSQLRKSWLTPAVDMIATGKLLKELN